MKNSPFVTIGVVASLVVLGCVILLLNIVAIPGNVAAADPGTCKASDIQGSISGNSATVKNVSDRTCTIGLAVFRLLDGPFSLDNQQLHRNDQRDFNPGKTITLSVELPQCDYQIDLYAGNFPGSAHFSSEHLIDANIVTGRCSTTPQLPAATTLTAQCVGGTTPRIVLNWNPVANQISNGVIKNVNNGNGAFIQPGPSMSQFSYTDTSVSFGNSYMYRVKTHPNVSSNVVTVVPTAASCGATTSTPTPTPPTTPTPGPTSLSCSPAIVLVSSGGTATFRANGGTGLYFWNAPGGDPSQGFYQDFSTRYFSSTEATNQVSVRSGSEIATCTVRVQAVGTPTPTPTPGVMSIQKTGRNITQGQATETTSVTVRSNDTVEFLIRVRSLSSSTLNNVIVQDALPLGVNYIPSTTSVNNILVQDGLTGGGINIGTLVPNQEALIRFSALIAPGTTFPSGSLTAINTAYGRADNVPTISAQATMTRTSIGTVAGVQTGPGETLLITLLVSGLLTYGYMLYTKTPLFSRRDALAKVRQYIGNPDRLNFMRFLK